jgi:hypothetical protein
MCRLEACPPGSIDRSSNLYEESRKGDSESCEHAQNTQLPGWWASQKRERKKCMISTSYCSWGELMAVETKVSMILLPLWSAVLCRL